MVAPPLVEPYIEEGRKLIELIKKSRLDVESAFWLYRPESDEWRLTIATKSVDQVGPRETYRKIQKVIPRDSVISLPDISVVSPRRAIVKGLTQSSRRTHEPTRRVRGQVVDGVYVDDALVYNLD